MPHHRRHGAVIFCAQNTMLVCFDFVQILMVKLPFFRSKKPCCLQLKSYRVKRRIYRPDGTSAGRYLAVVSISLVFACARVEFMSPLDPCSLVIAGLGEVEELDFLPMSMSSDISSTVIGSSSKGVVSWSCNSRGGGFKPDCGLREGSCDGDGLLEALSFSVTCSSPSLIRAKGERKGLNAASATML
jgi:hypothetical protein